MRNPLAIMTAECGFVFVGGLPYYLGDSSLHLYSLPNGFGMTVVFGMIVVVGMTVAFGMTTLIVMLTQSSLSLAKV